ncbi:MAG: DUF484 family protein [Rhodospirillaceae bacterium]
MAHGKDDPAYDAFDAPETQDFRLSDDDVAEFLVANPDFFKDRVEVLAHMDMPGRFGQNAGAGPDAQGAQVVDFQQVLLNQQREAVDELRECVRDVIDTSRANMSVQARTHKAALALLECRTMGALIRAVTDDLPMLLDVDVVCLGFEPAAEAPLWLGAAEVIRLRAGMVDALLRPDGAAKLYRDISDDGSVFGEAAGLVQSAAIARLRAAGGTAAGLIALGSRCDSFFQPGQGTELIVFLARVLDNCIDRLPADLN